MSAPDTNTELKQPAHKTPIVGMIAAVIFALVLLFVLITWLSAEGNNPAEVNEGENGISSEIIEQPVPVEPAAE